MSPANTGENMGRKFQQRLGTILLDFGIINSKDLSDAFRYQHAWNVRIGQAFVDLKVCSEETVLDLLSLQLGIEWVRLYGLDIADNILEQVPGNLATELRAMPLGFIRTGQLKVAMRDPHNLYHVELLRNASGCNIDPVLAADTDLAAAIARHYAPEGEETVVAENTPLATKLPAYRHPRATLSQR